ncbi:hypothetical protein BGX34_003326 [Mortierella sp. NVP85]|nr:hypothetical protein BGX34_003326 [Mortierella sp. NVP85]
MSNVKLLIMAVILCCLGISMVQACEGECRKIPTANLQKKYEKILNDQANTLSVSDSKKAKKLISKVTTGLDKSFSKLIFMGKFRGTCAKIGNRPPTEICGSAKSVACHAKWNIQDSWLVDVQKLVGDRVEQVYGTQKKVIRDAMIKNVKNYCPKNKACKSWEKEFEAMMLGFEKQEHQKEYGNKYPNCLPLGQGGI